jgi:hypothetical protein
MAKGITRTIRIEQDTNGAIQKLAEEEGISVNFLANKAIKTYLEWNVVARKLGLCSVSDSLMNRLVECHDEKKCEELGRRSAREVVEPYAEYLYGGLTVDNAEAVLRKLSQYGGRFEFAESGDAKWKILLLRHSSGKKWSIYYSGLIETIYKEMFGKTITLTCTEDLCIARIKSDGGRQT